MRKKALLVVDVQEGLFHKVMKIYKSELLLENINHLINSFRSLDLPIIFIRHTNKSMLLKNSLDWQVHSLLNQMPEDIYVNKVKSNVFEENDIIDILKKLEVEEIVVCGLVSHGCVKGACLGGLNYNYPVTLISDAHSNFNKRAALIINEVNEYLSNKGTRIVDLSTYLKE